MLTLTESAGVHLTDALAEAPEQAAVRLTVEQQSLAPRLDTAREDDVTFEHGGRTVLVLEPKLAEMLADRTLDTHETEQGPRLVLRVQVST
jgi:Fe-S cluster assembly iron-binding protein IscA